MDDHLASGQGGAPLGALDLHDQVVKAYGVVLVNGALASLREDQLQVPVPTGLPDLLSALNTLTSMKAAILLFIVAAISGAQSSSQNKVAQETQARAFWTDPSTALMWTRRDNGKA